MWRIYLLFLLLMANPVHATPSLEKLTAVFSEEFNATVRSYSTRDFGREKFEGAISVLVPEDEAREKLTEVRRRLPSGAFAFIGTTRNLSEDSVAGAELVVISSNDQFDVLRAAQTDGINYGLTNADIVAKLQEWDALYGVDIWHAETDTIELTLDRLPEDIEAFSNEIYAFCPDIVDQGSGEVGEIGDYLKASKAVYLWWD
ncbi:MAG: DUF4253 domain-containing protein [Pseudomonadota bacterium]